VFIKSQWLREDLKVKAVLSIRFRKDLDKAVAFLNRIPRWLKGTRFRPHTEKTLRRITAYGDEFLYGCEFWPGHPDWLLGEMIGGSAMFHKLWGEVSAPLRPKPHENRSRLELHKMFSVLRFFVSSYPLAVGFGPPTEADEETTRVYNRVDDDYPGDPYEDTEDPAEAEVDDESGHYFHFSDLQKWTDEQVLNLEHEKAFALEIAMEDAFMSGLFEYIPWPPPRPNRFLESQRLDVCLPSPQYRDPTIRSVNFNVARTCWNALFSSNPKSRSSV